MAFPLRVICRGSLPGDGYRRPWYQAIALASVFLIHASLQAP